MAEIKGIHKRFGTIIRVRGSIQPTDLENMKQWFRSPQTGSQIFLDLGQVSDISTPAILSLIDKLHDLKAQGKAVTVIRSTPEFKAALKKAKVDSSIWTLDYLDEAVFPFRAGLRPKITEAKSTETTLDKCPACGQRIRPGAFKCLHCGGALFPRRSERHTLAVPFFYNNLPTNEFMDSAWRGSVTEDLDVKTFSGIGFFSAVKMPMNSVLNFIFPTLHWDSREEQRNRLNIFMGRIKHCTFAGDFYRIGVALYDMFEYQGRFDVKMEGEDNSETEW